MNERKITEEQAKKEYVKGDKNQKMEDEKNVKSKLILSIIIVGLLLIIGGLLNQGFHNLFEKEKINTAYVSGKLENMSELTTQKLTYSGIYNISEGEIPFITEKGFTMSYNAEVKAVIDFNDVDIDINKKTIKIKIPHATIQNPEINEDSIRFISEKRAIFNWTKKEDITKAISTAEEYDLKKMDFLQLLTNADTYAEVLLHKIFDGSVGKREVEISFK